MILKLCQIDTTVGAFRENTDKIIDIIKKEKEYETNILVFPELAVSGYPPLDLLDNPNFIDSQEQYTEEIVEATKGLNSLIIFGYIEKNRYEGKKLFNSLLVCSNGVILHNYRKRCLPTYDVFDERRYFEPGKETGLISFQGKRIGLAICEDIWLQEDLYRQNIIKELFKIKADFVLTINASPSVVGKLTQRILIVKNYSNLYDLPIAYVNMVGGNDDIIFDGNSFMTNQKGHIIKQAKRFEEDIIEINLEELCNGTIDIPQKINSYDSNAQFFFEQIKAGIKSYVEKCDFKSVVIALSGGIDSALVTALATLALGRDKVTAITMPSQYSSVGSCEDSYKLGENLHIPVHTISIKEIFNVFKEVFRKQFDIGKEHSIMEQNLQARIRGMIMMSYSNLNGSLVLSTGNKSELSVGYCTIGGDMLGGLAPISDLYKTEVYDLAKYINKSFDKEIIPEIIIYKEPSAELAPGQKDTDNLPEYQFLDGILKYLVEGDLIDKYLKEQRDEFLDAHEKEVKEITKLLNRAEFKRRQGPITLKVHEKAFGYGRRVPIVHGWY